MNDENKTVTKITEPDSLPVLMKSRMTEEQPVSYTHLTLPTILLV